MRVDAPTQISGCSIYLAPPELLCSCLLPLLSCISCRFAPLIRHLAFSFIIALYVIIPVPDGVVKILGFFLALLMRIGLHTTLRTCNTFVRYILLLEVLS